MTEGHWLWEGERGRVEVRQLGPLFATVELTGKVEESAVPVIDEALGKLMPIPGLAIYWDASRLESFVNAFRAKSTEHILAHRKTVGEIAVLSQSALIAMAVSATNLALGVARLFRRDLPSLRHGLVQRHVMIDRLVAEARCPQVLELAAGLSRRGAAMSDDPQLRYVEVDLPAVIAHKRKLLARTARVVLGRAGTYAGARGGFDLARPEEPDG